MHLQQEGSCTGHVLPAADVDSMVFGSRICALAALDVVHAYPQFWAYQSAAFMSRLKPGGPFDAMAIAACLQGGNKAFRVCTAHRSSCDASTLVCEENFELSTGPCTLSSSIPSTGSWFASGQALLAYEQNPQTCFGGHRSPF